MIAACPLFTDLSIFCPFRNEKPEKPLYIKALGREYNAGSGNNIFVYYSHKALFFLCFAQTEGLFEAPLLFAICPFFCPF